MCLVEILFGANVIQSVVPVFVGFRETLKSAGLMNLSYEDESCEKMLEKIIWLSEEKQYLK